MISFQKKWAETLGSGDQVWHARNQNLGPVLLLVMIRTMLWTRGCVAEMKMHSEFRRRERNWEARVLEGFSHLTVEVTKNENKRSGEREGCHSRGGEGRKQCSVFSDWNWESQKHSSKLAGGWHCVLQRACANKSLDAAKMEKVGSFLPQGSAEKTQPPPESTRGGSVSCGQPGFS